MDNIQHKLQLLNEHFRKSDQPESVRLLQRIVKLNEEVGELCEAALTEVDPDQRKKDKVIDFDEELADVIICALMLSTGRSVNILETVEQKLDKVLTRFNLE